MRKGKIYSCVNCLAFCPSLSQGQIVVGIESVHRFPACCEIGVTIELVPGKKIYRPARARCKKPLNLKELIREKAKFLKRILE